MAQEEIDSQWEINIGNMVREKSNTESLHSRLCNVCSGIVVQRENIIAIHHCRMLEDKSTVRSSSKARRPTLIIS